MQSSLVIAALFCLTTWMSMVHAIYRPGASCCVQWSKTRVPLERIVNYTIQSEDSCRIKAVLLRTVRGKTICANPDGDWTKQAIQKVDNESRALQEKRQNEEGSASEMTPVASTASTKSQSTPRKNGRRGKGQKRKYRRGNRRQRTHA
ncbi:C-C motif chemokine 20-like [Archocentrus centrarchus]|uniref:C-C motif chemokine 20-like n=1 Tax=Archocentrus centrarchus TaxID=63155 RepID=UPI0011E9D4DF|nr:C-C motif chemokine 20-like [Archocentrus centrarchus]